MVNFDFMVKSCTSRVYIVAYWKVKILPSKLFFLFRRCAIPHDVLLILAQIKS